MNRRGFFGALLAVACAPFIAKSANPPMRLDSYYGFAALRTDWGVRVFDECDTPECDIFDQAAYTWESDGHGSVKVAGPDIA